MCQVSFSYLWWLCGHVTHTTISCEEETECRWTPNKSIIIPHQLCLGCREGSSVPLRISKLLKKGKEWEKRVSVEDQQREMMARNGVMERAIRSKARVEMTPEERLIAEAKEAQRQNEDQERELRQHELVLCYYGDSYRDPGYGRLLDRSYTRHLVLLYTTLYERLKYTAEPSVRDLRRLGRMERAIQDVDLSHLVERRHCADVQMQARSVQNLQRTIYAMANTGHSSGISDVEERMYDLEERLMMFIVELIRGEKNSLAANDERRDGAILDVLMKFCAEKKERKETNLIGRTRLAKISTILFPVAMSSLSSEDQCPICTETYGVPGDNELTENPVKLPCDHTAGKLCLTTWLSTNDSCPVCRRQYSEIVII